MMKALLAQNKNNKLHNILNQLSHDLKNPISNIIGFSGLLEHLAEDCENPDMASFIRIIKAEAEYANKIINKLQDYTTNNTSKQHVKEEDIKEILDTAKKEYKAVF